MPRKIRISKPIEHRDFAKRPRLPATGKPKDSAPGHFAQRRKGLSHHSGAWTFARPG